MPRLPLDKEYPLDDLAPAAKRRRDQELTDAIRTENLPPPDYGLRDLPRAKRHEIERKRRSNLARMQALADESPERTIHGYAEEHMREAPYGHIQPISMDMEQDYLRVRQQTDEWQTRMMAVAGSGTGTLEDPLTELRIPAQPGAMTQPAPQPQAGAEESIAPEALPAAGTFTSEPPIRSALKAVGKKGKELAEAVHPGLVTAGRAIGLDEEQAETMATGITEFIAGLPGPDEESDETAGLETVGAMAPIAGVLGKGGKAAKRAAKAAKASASARIPTWDEAVKIDESQRKLDDLMASFTERLSKQRRGVRSDVQVRTESISPEALSIEQYLDLPPGSIANDRDVVAIKRMFKELAEPVRLLAKHLVDNPHDSEAFLMLLEQLPKVDQGVTRIAGVYAESGRTQRMLSSKLPTKGTVPAESEERVRISDEYVKQWLAFFQKQNELAKMGAPAMTQDKLIGALANMKSEEDLITIVKAMDRPGKWDMFLEYWINGLLSGPQTHAVNMLSNAATIAWAIPERAVAGMYSGAVRPTEATAMLGGVMESFGDAMRLAWQAFKEEHPQFGQSKLEMPRRAITADALELTGVPGRAVDLLGSAVRLPGRALMAEDDFFKTIAFRAELHALARRESSRQVVESGLSGASARARRKAIEAEILAHPERYESIAESAREFANYVTFTSELGSTGQKIQLAASTPVGRIILPFVRTPANIFKYFGERTPLAFASNAVREELKAGGERRALALAKISLGSMTMAYLGTLAAEGIITGGGPKDKALRQELLDTGWKPYAFKIGDQYYQYSRIEPLGSLIGLAADAADLLGQLPQKDADKLAAALVVAVQRNVAQKTFIKGLAGTINAISSQDINTVSAFMEKELPTILPYSSAMKQTAHYTDPVLRDVSTMLQAFQAATPGYSDRVPPHRNLWGEAITLGGGLGPDLISPIYTSSQKMNPVSQELVRLELPVGMPARSIEGVPLTPEEYDAYVRLQGGKRIYNDQTLKESLADLMHSELYRNASDPERGDLTSSGKVALIRQRVSLYRNLAAIILQDPEQTREYLPGEKFQDLRARIDAQRNKKAQRFNVR